MYSNIVHYSLYKLQHQKTLLNIIKFNVFDTIACFARTCKIYNLKRDTTTGLHHNLHIVILLISFSILNVFGYETAIHQTWMKYIAKVFNNKYKYFEKNKYKYKYCLQYYI